MNTEEKEKMSNELRIISLFVEKQKRARLRNLVKANKRDHIIPYFNDPRVFEKKYITEFKGRKRSINFLVDQYQSLGMRDEIYVISSNVDWDAKTYRILSILDMCLMEPHDTIGFCLRSETAFYEWHHSGVSYFLCRNSA